MSELTTELYMVFDVESIGLHGEGFSVGWCVIDGNGKTVASAQYACDPDMAHGSADDRIWVKENIPAPNQGYNCSAPRWVREEFWRAWMYAKAKGAVLAADVPWPVEARFLAQCIDDESGRKWDGPYPLIDIASVRLASGLDPLAAVERRLEEIPQHDPLCDARQSARLLTELLALRQARDAGDTTNEEAEAAYDAADPIPISEQEVERLMAAATGSVVDEEIENKMLEISRWIGTEPKCSSERKSCDDAVDELQNLQSIAIARGQQLRFQENNSKTIMLQNESLSEENLILVKQLQTAREEIANLKLERDGAVACMDSRLSQIATLTAERDEARRKYEDMNLLAKSRLESIDTITAELVAIKSCQELREVDALVNEYLTPQVSRADPALWFLKMQNIAHRSITSHAAVIADLKTVDKANYLGELRHMAAYDGDSPSEFVLAARRILSLIGKGG